MDEDVQLHTPPEHPPTGERPSHKHVSGGMFYPHKHNAGSGPTRKRKPPARKSPQSASVSSATDEYETDPEWMEYVAETLAKRCYYCNFANPPEAAVCENCGRQLEVFCPECGYPNQPDWAECASCDAPLFGARPEDQEQAAPSYHRSPGENQEETSYDAGTRNTLSFLMAILGLGAFTWAIVQISRSGSSYEPLIWTAALPVALILFLIAGYFYVRWRDRDES